MCNGCVTTLFFLYVVCLLFTGQIRKSLYASLRPSQHNMPIIINWEWQLVIWLEF